jgi:hypothetical protein
MDYMRVLWMTGEVPGMTGDRRRWIYSDLASFV